MLCEVERNEKLFREQTKSYERTANEMAKNFKENNKDVHNRIAPLKHKFTYLRPRPTCNIGTMCNHNYAYNHQIVLIMRDSYWKLRFLLNLLAHHFYFTCINNLAAFISPNPIFAKIKLKSWFSKQIKKKANQHTYL